MRYAFLLHGTGGSSKDYFWFADTKQYLEQHGYQVWWPELPNTQKPELLETEDYILDNWPGITSETIIIGHSSACPLILHLLESLKVKVKQVILVSGYYQKISDQANNMLPASFNWEAIKAHASEIILINSDDDPWGCSDAQARPAAGQLGATFILAKGQGHMGSNAYNQPYKEFKVLKDLIKV